MSVSAAFYRQRNPQSSPYYQCVEDHFEAFKHIYEERFERRYGFFHPYVKEVIYRYLDCGVLHSGFARIRCKDCGHEYLLLSELSRCGWERLKAYLNSPARDSKAVTSHIPNKSEQMIRNDR